MTDRLVIALALVGACLAADVARAADAQLPEGVRAMIDAAIAGGDPKAVETVLRLARQTQQSAAGEIDRIEQDFRATIAQSEAEKAQARQEALASAGLLDEWTGQVELGASRSTGNSRNVGFFGAVGVNREGLEWRHKITARADLQQTNGATTAERIVASWQPYYRIDDGFYGYGIGEYEHDRFQGYANRYTLGGGIGYGLALAPTAKIDFEGGPALRHTDFLREDAASTLAARASLNLNWTITPTLQLKQNSAFYYETGDTSANILSAVDATLLGTLKARFSYDVRYESDVPAGAAALNTQSRATLVYGF